MESVGLTIVLNSIKYRIYKRYVRYFEIQERYENKRIETGRYYAII